MSHTAPQALQWLQYGLLAAAIFCLCMSIKWQIKSEILARESERLAREARFYRLYREYILSKCG